MDFMTAFFVAFGGLIVLGGILLLCMALFTNPQKRAAKRQANNKKTADKP